MELDLIKNFADLKTGAWAKFSILIRENSVEIVLLNFVSISFRWRVFQGKIQYLYNNPRQQQTFAI